MPTWLIIVLAVLGGLILVFALGGAVAVRRRERAQGDFHHQVEEVDRALAAAHAQDKGWEPAALEAAAREAFAQRHPGVEARELALVQVVDRPGTDEDRAVFRFLTADGEVELTLGRRAGAWAAE